MFDALVKLLCNQQVEEFLKLCDLIAFPVSLDKTFWGIRQLVFLGLLTDTIYQCVCIPVEKVQKATLMIDSIIQKKE